MAIESLHRRRTYNVFSKKDYQIIKEVQSQVKRNNVDNVSRTEAYRKFYRENPEIIWSLLANMVSRNAGWNMTDLTTTPYKKLMSARFRKLLFLTYERPNWLIFEDAYPQLLIYAYSKRAGRPLFHLLKAFEVSVFAEAEWVRFWEEGDRERLCVSLIINEQNVIEKPVISHRYFHHKVFDGVFFRAQEFLHQNAVVFPNCQGELYGFSVYRFCHLNKRIEMGKKLAWLLFKSPESGGIRAFGIHIPHTGSRADYENFVIKEQPYESVALRDVYFPVRHKRLVVSDWYQGLSTLDKKWSKPFIVKNYHLTHWYRRKQQQTKWLSRVSSHFLSE